MCEQGLIWNILRCPICLERLEVLDSWLFASAHEDLLFPVICGVPVIQPDTDGYIQQYGTAIMKAMAMLETCPDSREWFFKRYGPLSFHEMPNIDSLIEGEGYPGFYKQLEIPSFLSELHTDFSDDLIFDMVGKHHPDLALDIGCGQGGMAYRMSSICREVIGVESHFFLAALAHKYMKSDHITIHSYDPEIGRQTVELPKNPVSNVQIICADARYLPFAEPLFDWVHMGHLVDLVPEPEDILQHIMKILKPGGTLSISTPMDFEDQSHLDEFAAILDEEFTCTFLEQSIPWLKYNHKRRWVVHEDWIWIGKLRK
ncbi:MAG: hypothetical protein CSA81_03675 [Acidobacteria bacterium]|nr:MAG: hypothetical protein CSA81_03675 [Acidobacteriota bacterium]